MSSEGAQAICDSTNVVAYGNAEWGFSDQGPL
jgi:hypothetical protein